MIGYGTHNQPAGTWSDDSSMTLTTIDSLCGCGSIDLEDIMTGFELWADDAWFTPHGEVFDIGLTTRLAIANWIKDHDVKTCGLTGERDNGNGSLMRILPLAFVPGVTREDIHAVSALTHAHEISKVACEIYIDIAQRLLAGVPKSQAIFSSFDGFWPEPFERIGHLDCLDRDDIRSTGYVVDTLEAALWCLLNTDNYRDCVLTAVNLGDDTDTVAAVAGGLAGILYGIGGERGIPEEWISGIAQKDEIKVLCGWFEGVY
jgi:ADP-ribosylglycohydrolase